MGVPSFRFFICLLTALFAGWASVAAAQGNNRIFDKELSLFKLRQENNQAYESLAHLSYIERQEYELAYEGPQEPYIPVVKFKGYAKPQHLQGQIASLVHGVTIGLPAEYDHYGYELRRLMASVGNYNIYKSRDEVQEQLVNIQKARVVFKYWREDLLKRIADLQQQIDDGQGGAKEIATLNRNAALIKAFMIEIQSWLNANESFLNYLINNQREYKPHEGNKLLFALHEKRKRFTQLYEVRERARHEIYKYDPFRIMVY